MEEQEALVEPIYDRRAEVEHHLAEDDTVLGRYWRYTQEGLSREEMAAREGLETSGWISNYESILQALRDGRVADCPAELGSPPLGSGRG